VSSVYFDTNGNNLADTRILQGDAFNLTNSNTKYNFTMSYIYGLEKIGIGFRPNYVFNDFGNFGGASIAGMNNGRGGVGQRNVEFIEEFTKVEDIPVVSRDLGGYLPRQIHFYTDTGKVQVKRLGLKPLRLTRIEEAEHLRQVRQHGPQFGEITLFE